jgi:hypothetical protein
VSVDVGVALDPLVKGANADLSAEEATEHDVAVVMYFKTHDVSYSLNHVTTYYWMHL